jgi:hypothetical protein
VHLAVFRKRAYILPVTLAGKSIKPFPLCQQVGKELFGEIIINAGWYKFKNLRGKNVYSGIYCVGKNLTPGWFFQEFFNAAVLFGYDNAVTQRLRRLCKDYRADSVVLL